MKNTPHENLQLIYDRFKEMIKPEEFEFSTLHISRECGTAGCVVGWFPRMFPNAGFKYADTKTQPLLLKGQTIFGSGETTAHLEKLTGLPSHIVSYLFYGSCTYMSDDAPIIGLQSSYDEVMAAWEWVIENYDIAVIEEGFTYSLS